MGAQWANTKMGPFMSKGFLGLTFRENESVIIILNGVEVEVIMGKKVGSSQRRLLFRAPKEVRIIRSNAKNKSIREEENELQ